jgi:hypothetical protein
MKKIYIFSAILGSVLSISNKAAEPPPKKFLELLNELSEKTKNAEKETESMEEELGKLADKKAANWGDILAANYAATLLKNYIKKGIINKDNIDEVNTFITEAENLAKKATEKLQKNKTEIETNKEKLKRKQEEISHFKQKILTECIEKNKSLEEENKKLKDTLSTKQSWLKHFYSHLLTFSKTRTSSSSSIEGISIITGIFASLG